MTAPTLDSPVVDVPVDVPAPPDNLWHGLIVPTNVPAGDGRVFQHDGGDVVPIRPLPLPLKAQRYEAEGHDGAEVVGMIRHVWMEPDGVHAQGTFSDTDAGREWAERVRSGERWISGDFADCEWEKVVVDRDGAPVDAAALADDVLPDGARTNVVYGKWEITGATLLAAPAFAESYAVSGPAPLEVPEPTPGPLGDTLTAAGVVYAAEDFADPHLDGPTALTITDDGRVYGHLATWGTCHIGMPGCTTAPSSASDYAYFRQGLVRTTAGDLPVGKITMGIGHASTARGTRWADAASHYDNVNSAVAVVAAGEDQFGIWLAGHMLPGTPDEKIDQLRASGVSGDWRGIRGNMELVAALAVNVPGFPVPRSHGLVAAGGGALVAAGIVTPERAAVLRAAEQDDEALVAAGLRARMNALRMGPIIASAKLQQAADLDARMALVAAGLPAAPTAPAPPADDHTEDGMVALLPSEGDAQRLSVAGGEPADELHVTVAYFPDAAAMDPTHLADVVADLFPEPVLGEVSGRADFTGGDRPCAVYLVQAPGLSAAHDAIAPEGTFDAYVPHITAGYDVASTALTEGGPITFDRARIAVRGEYQDVPLGAIVAAGSAMAVPADDEQQKGQRIVRTQEGATRYGVDVGQPIPVGGKGDQQPAQATQPAKTMDADVNSVWEKIKRENPADDGSSGKSKSKSGSGSGAKKSDDTTTKGQVPSGSKKLGSSTPARLSGDSKFMEEDESPEKGAKGGKLTNYEAGVAYYDDGTISDGASWYTQAEKPATSTKATSTKSSSTKSTSSKTTPTSSSSTTTANPVESFFKALGELLGVKPTSTPAPAQQQAPPQLNAQQRQELRTNLEALRRYLDEQDRNQQQNQAAPAAGRAR